jgi:hypothetical protein
VRYFAATASHRKSMFELAHSLLSVHAAEIALMARAVVDPWLLDCKRDALVEEIISSMIAVDEVSIDFWGHKFGVYRIPDIASLPWDSKTFTAKECAAFAVTYGEQHIVANEEYLELVTRYPFACRACPYALFLALSTMKIRS